MERWNVSYINTEGAGHNKETINWLNVKFEKYILQNPEGRELGDIFHCNLSSSLHGSQGSQGMRSHFLIIDSTDFVKKKKKTLNVHRK